MPKQKVVTTRGGRPSPQDALLEFFGGNPPEDPRVGLAGARNAQLDEMKHNAENARFGNGYVSGANPSDIAGLEQDINEDPYTGLAAKKSLADREKTMADEQAYMTPGATDVRASQQKDKLAQLLAVPEAQGQNALALEREKNAGALKLQGGEQAFTREFVHHGEGASPNSGEQQFTPNIGPDGRVSLHGVAQKPMGQLEQRAITSFKEAQPILDQLDAKLGNPSDNMLAQLLSKGGNMAANGMYSSGLKTGDQTKVQLEGLLRVLGSSPYVVGSRSYQMILQAMKHLTDVNGSDAFNKQQINEMRSLWPAMQDEIIAAHNTPGSPLNQGDPYSDPNYQPR